MKPSEFKFKVWDYDSSLFYNYIELDADENFIIFPDLIKFKNFEILLYSGLQDKNGKEIYEGDIVKLVIDEKEYIWSVEFRFGAFRINDRNIIQYFDISEIIGNKFENPELLNKET